MEKTEERIAKEKDAVAKVIGAKSAMEAALSRINTLESALKAACETGIKLAGFAPSNSYEYRGERSIQVVYKEAFTKLSAVL